MQNVLNWFSPTELADAETQRRANVLMRIILISLVGSLIFGLTSYVMKWGGAGPIESAVYALLALGCIGLIRRGHLDLPGLLLPLVLLALVTSQAIRNHGPHDQAILIYPLIITFAWLLLSRRMALIFLGLSLASAFLLIYLEVNQFIQPHIEGASEYSDIITFVVVLAAIAFLADSVMGSLRDAIKQLQQSEHDLLQQTEALAQREAEIRLFIEEAPNGICILNSQRQIELINSRACEMLGYTEQEMLGREATEFISYEELERLPLISGDKLDRGRLAREQRVLTRKDGSTLWVLGSLRRFPDGKYQYTIQDLTEQKQLEQSLRESEEHYRTFIALSSEAIWRMDFNPPIPTNLPTQELVAQILQTGVLVECNEPYAHTYGYENPKELEGKLWANTIPSPIASADLDILKQFIDSDFRLEDVETFSNDEGSPQYFVSNIIGIVEEGKLIRAWGTFQNITERKLAEAALFESEQRYRGAIIAAGLVPYEINYLEKRFSFVGDDILKLTGYTLEEFSPQILKESVQEDYIWGRNEKLTPEEARRLFRAGELKEWHSDMRIRTRTGESRWLSDSSIEIKDEFGKVKGAIGIFQDITDRKNIETKLENLINELEKRNTELERFAYTLSHELKTPIVTIRGYLGSLQNDIANRKFERIDHDVLRVNRAADRMQQLMQDLIQLFQVGRVTYQPVELSFVEIVQEALKQVTDAIQKRGIRVHIQPELPMVTGDRTQLIEMLYILLENAIKFMGGQPHPLIEIGTRTDQANATIFFIKDNGVGVEPTYHEKIFGLFNKLDAMSEGTGVGLTLVQQMIELHGGQIWVESQGLGQGATFCFTLSSKQKGNK